MANLTRRLSRAAVSTLVLLCAAWYFHDSFLQQMPNAGLGDFRWYYLAAQQVGHGCSVNSDSRTGQHPARCVARFETPAGTISRVVMEYPTPAVAQERAESFRALPGAAIRIAGRRLGVVFSQPGLDQAEELLRVIARTEMSEDSFVS